MVESQGWTSGLQPERPSRPVAWRLSTHASACCPRLSSPAGPQPLSHLRVFVRADASVRKKSHPGIKNKYGIVHKNT